MRKEEVKQEERRVLQEINTNSFFTYKNTTRNMKIVFVVRWSTEVCFVFEKTNNKLRIQSRDLNNREHKQNVFLGNRKEILCSPICSKRRECFFKLKMDNRKENIE